MVKTIKYLIKASQKNGISFIKILILHFYYYCFKKKNVFSHPNVQIKGLKNINTKGPLRIGLNYVGFIHKKDFVLLNIQGQLNINGDFSIGQGCRLDFSKGSVVNFGNNSCITAFTKLIIMHGLIIGNNCSISWDCLIIDDDFHQINYTGKNLKPNDNQIVIGNNVWIGSNVSIFKGVNIPNGCIVASNSVLKSAFNEENSLIAGNPAKVIKHGVKWN
jgi:acetyltransferase-like isoleucine patch superfamily enzyme